MWYLEGSVRQGWAKVKLWPLDSQMQWLEHCSIKQAHQHPSLPVHIRKRGYPGSRDIRALRPPLHRSAGQCQASIAATSTLGKHWVKLAVKWFKCSAEALPGTIPATALGGLHLMVGVGGSGLRAIPPAVFAPPENVLSLLFWHFLWSHE